MTAYEEALKWREEMCQFTYRIVCPLKRFNGLQSALKFYTIIRDLNHIESAVFLESGKAAPTSRLGD
jgi:hypothetical protein